MSNQSRRVNVILTTEVAGLKQKYDLELKKLESYQIGYDSDANVAYDDGKVSELRSVIEDLEKLLTSAVDYTVVS